MIFFLLLRINAMSIVNIVNFTFLKTFFAIIDYSYLEPDRKRKMDFRIAIRLICAYKRKKWSIFNRAQVGPHAHNLVN